MFGIAALRRSCFPCLLLGLFVSSACAESLPHWKPDQLVPRSGLVVLASQTGPAKLTIQMVFKGVAPKREIEIPALTEFSPEFSPLSGLAKPDLTEQVVAFISLRHGNSIIANGVYRVTEKGQLLGYAQEENPGPYRLNPEPVYESLDALVAEIDAAKQEAPKRQQSLMDQIANAKSDSAHREALHELNEITCLGDTKVFNFIASQMARGGNRGRQCLYFLQNIPDPAIFPLLKAHYEKTRRVAVLNVIGQQGCPDAAAFLKQVVLQGGSREKREFAGFALMTLYLSLETRGKYADCKKVEKTIFDLFDKEPAFREYVKSSPRVLGVIPNLGAITRLEKLYEQVKGDRSNREFEIERVLSQCRCKIEKTASAATR